MRHLNKAAVTAALSLLLAGAVACGGDSGSAATPQATSGTTAATSTGPTEIGEPTREVIVSMLDNYFEPEEIRVAVGEAVNIVAKNDGVAIHNMHVLSSATEGQDFRSAPLVNPGDSSEFVVQFSQAGTYKFQCDLHLPDMVGEFIVE